MSQENVELVRAGYERYATTGELGQDSTADFVWDVSNLHWPGQQIYEGADGARTFLREWADPWEDWEVEADSFHDAGDRVVVLVRQRARSKSTGMPVEMSFAQIWTLRDGKRTRMEMYSDRPRPSQPPGCRNSRSRGSGKECARSRRSACDTCMLAHPGQ
jgi:ketosteroid isomerase-like protein